MSILVLGGDGYCGWPTALHLSDAGHEVVIVDNFSRIDEELGTRSLTPIASLKEHRADLDVIAPRVRWRAEKARLVELQMAA